MALMHGMRRSESAFSMILSI
uniref:Uncharacterized protein n=1 Tax=Rhizophora mucronata TaxID=61149 RepID=A0A2P2N8J9_RHIMU